MNKGGVDQRLAFLSACLYMSVMKKRKEGLKV